MRSSRAMRRTKRRMSKRKPRVVGDEVAPEAPGDRHLPLHLGDVSAGRRLAEQRLDVGGGQRALDLDQAVIADEPVWAGAGHGDRRVIEEADLGHIGVLLEGVDLERLGFLLLSPAHGRALERFGLHPGQPLADQLGGVVGS